MVKLSEIARRAPRILLLGPHGTGKTALTLTLGARLRMVDVDDGVLTGQTFKDGFTKDRGEVEVKSCAEDRPDIPSACTKALAAVKQFDKEIRSGKCPQQAIALDSFTRLQEAAMSEVLYADGKLGEPPLMQHWQPCYAKLQVILNYLRTMPCAVILIGHLQRIDVNGKIISDLFCSGKALGPKVPTYFDEVWIMDLRKDAEGKMEYVVQSKPSQGMQTRTRYNLADAKRADLGLVRIFKDMGYEFPARGGNADASNDQG